MLLRSTWRQQSSPLMQKSEGVCAVHWLVNIYNVKGTRERELATPGMSGVY